MENDLWKAREPTLDDLLEARLCRGRERYRIAVAAQPRVHPDDVDDTGTRGDRRVAGAYGHEPDPAVNWHGELQTSPLICPDPPPCLAIPAGAAARSCGKRGEYGNTREPYRRPGSQLDSSYSMDLDLAGGRFASDREADGEPTIP